MTAKPESPRTPDGFWPLIDKAKREKGLADRVVEEVGIVCVYCGEDATHIDHLLPRLWTGEVLRRFVPVVPACQDCNCTIGGDLVVPLHERARLVAERLHKRHKKLLECSWTNEELGALGRGIRGSVRAAEVKRRIILSRLRVLEAGGMAAYLGHYDPDQ